MARQKRMISEQRIYHIVMKGINANRIFVKDSDYSFFMKFFKEACRDYDVEMLAYCLMSNHIHLMLKFNDDNMTEMFKSFGAKYVPKYNSNHDRIGPLFNGRFYSSPINDDGYLLAVIRYIHYNPVKAGISKSLDEYRWSSYKEYSGSNEGVADTEFIKNMYSDSDLQLLHIIDNDVLDEAFIFDSWIDGADYSDVAGFLKENEKRNKEELIELLKRAKISKSKIANFLRIDKRNI